MELEAEQRRLHVLHELELLDTEHEEEFDELVQLASEICQTPISLVSLVDSERQWFKATYGTDLRETSREVSFCAHAIGQAELFMVEDATRDPRFCRNPLVTDGPGIRFYAGIPLYATEQMALGTLCVVDTVPRSLTLAQQNALRILARQVQTRIEMRAQRAALERAVKENARLAASLKLQNNTLEAANAKLEQLASVDSLTRLFNRRVFEERSEHQFAVAERKLRPLALLLIDIDDFKKRNDTFGHQAGDEALRAIGRVLSQVVRAGDVAARLGGEEFGVLMPETDAEQALALAERLLAEFRRLPFSSGALTASIGVAVKDMTTRSWDRLLGCADDAMYEAKQQGKDRIILHGALTERWLAEARA
jgi:diguanylate cyclase (GGDEF)-like protein